MKKQKHSLKIRMRDDTKLVKWQVDFRGIPAKFWPSECAQSGQKSYDSEAIAQAAAQAAWDDYQVDQHEGVILSAQQKEIANEAFRRMEGYDPAALLEAVELFREYRTPGQKQRTVAELVEEFLESRKIGVAPVTHREYAYKLRRFLKAFSARPAHALDTLEIDRWMDHLGFTGYTRKTYRRYIKMVFKFGVDRNYIKSDADPTRGLTKPKLPNKTPRILTAGETARLMDEARDYKLGRMIPYFALAVFCGVRPEEIKRIMWSDITMETAELYVSKDASKTNADRFVNIPENAMEWLRLIPPATRTGSIYWTRHDFEQVRRKAGLVEQWKATPDICRHTAASHLYALTQNAAATIAQMGHGLTVFMKHYKRAVQKSEAEKFFQIRPETAKGKIIQLAASA